MFAGSTGTSSPGPIPASVFIGGIVDSLGPLGGGKGGGCSLTAARDAVGRGTGGDHVEIEPGGGGGTAAGAGGIATTGKLPVRDTGRPSRLTSPESSPRARVARLPSTGVSASRSAAI